VQLAGRVDDLGDALSGIGGESDRDRLAPAARQQVGQRRYDEQQGDRGGDRSRRVPDQRAEREAEQATGQRDEAAAEHRAQHGRRGQARGQVVR